MAPPKPQSTEPLETKDHYEFPTEDTVPLEKLKLLGNFYIINFSRQWDNNLILIFFLFDEFGCFKLYLNIRCLQELGQ